MSTSPSTPGLDWTLDSVGLLRLITKHFVINLSLCAIHRCQVEVHFLFIPGGVGGRTTNQPSIHPPSYHVGFGAALMTNVRINPHVSLVPQIFLLWFGMMSEEPEVANALFDRQVHGLHMKCCYSGYLLRILTRVPQLESFDCALIGPPGYHVATGYNNWPYTLITAHILSSAYMNTISQSLLPSSPIRNIPVRYSTRQQADGTARLLEACNQSYMGVATKQYADGKVEMIAFATPGEVFVISVEADNRPGLLPSDQSFGLLLLSTAGILVGFDMGKLALRLHRDLKLPTRGIDLSTLFAQNTRDPWRPSKFIGTKVSPLVNKFEVDNLWNSASEQGSRNVCLRAWLAAWCVSVYHPLIFLV